jgi:hypothetical protein
MNERYGACVHLCVGVGEVRKSKIVDDGEVSLLPAVRVLVALQSCRNLF